MKKKLWGGAHGSSDEGAVLFAAASDIAGKNPPENLLIPYDIRTNLAHVKTLHNAGLLSEKELKQLEGALNDLLNDYEAGELVFDPTYEDIHSQIETLITEKLGDTGKKIHTGRSRNDQVTTDMYLLLRDRIGQLADSISGLVVKLEQTAQENVSTVCPGYTHHQKAVVTSFGDILTGYRTMFARDIERFKQVTDLYDYSPLGAATGYESLIPADKELSAKNLGFAAGYRSSVDVITTRGEFEAAFAQAASLFMAHVSMLAQLLIMFSSQAYGFITLDDKYTTGSSIMPQKKNPDLLEIMKAKSIYVQSLAGSLTSLLQGTFVGYNRDSQYSKMLVANLLDEVGAVPEYLGDMVSSLHVDKAKMSAAADADFVTSTGFMELLVINKDLALRDAKRLMEKAVAFSQGSGQISREAFEKAREELSLDVELDDQTIRQWQDPVFQLTSRRRRFGV